MFSTDFKDGNVIIHGLADFDLPHTLDCGQAFRWEKAENGNWQGVAHGRMVELAKQNDGSVIIYNVDENEFKEIWQNYFDLDRDYKKIIEDISSNIILKNAAEYSYGIRILNQDPWETLCSFIISQNNNIKRIKGIISRLCSNFGEDKGGYYTFPSFDKIAQLTLDDLAVLRSGFRAKYILDAAKKVNDGEVDLESLRKQPIDDARNELMKINGVGPKVADCVLLFSLGHSEAFPKDVWIKRAMEVMFDGKLPNVAIPYAGIVQQYIFFYARETKLVLDI